MPIKNKSIAKKSMYKMDYLLPKSNYQGQSLLGNKNKYSKALKINKALMRKKNKHNFKMIQPSDSNMKIKIPLSISSPKKTLKPEESF